MATGTLPKAPLSMSADDQAQTEYFAALNKTLQALEERQGPNMYNLAAAFLDPGKTGSFGEAAGRAASSLGRDYEQQQAQAIPIAQMRAQLAAQKYEVASRGKALGMLSQVMGLSPADAVQGLSEGTLPAEVTARLTPQVLMQIATVNKEVGDMAFKAADQETKQNTVALEKQKFDWSKQKDIFDQRVKSFEAELGMLKAKGDIAGQQVAYAKLIDEIGKPAADSYGVTPPVMPSNVTMPSGTLPPVRPGQPAAVAPTPMPTPAAQTAPAPNAPMQAPAAWASSMPRQDVQPEFVNVPQPAPRPMPAPAAPPAPVATTAPVNAVMPPQTQRKLAEETGRSDLQISEQAAKERDKPYIEKYNMISSYDTNTVNQNNAKYGELMALVQKYPQVAGQLVHQGPMYALLQAAESGVTTPVGSVSVPVSEAISKMKLNPQEQAAARNMAQLISDLNQTVMKQGKSIYGPQISTFDAQKMAEPGFKSTDPASFIGYLAAKNKVVNTYMGRLSDAQQEYFEANPRATTTSFFRSSEYKRIVDQFNATYKALVDKSPFK